MYTVFSVLHREEAQRYILHDPRTADYHILDPALVMKANKSGSFSFTVPPTNAHKDKIRLYDCTVIVYQDGSFLWAGRPILCESDLYHNQQYTCEGVLGYLLDLPIGSVPDTSRTPSGWLQYVTSQNYAALCRAAASVTTDQPGVWKTKPVYPHIAQRRYRSFYAAADSDYDQAPVYDNYGNETGTEERKLRRWTESAITPMEFLQTRLIDYFGGFLEITESDSEGSAWGIRYCDPVKNKSKQELAIGKNILDQTMETDLTDFCTAYLPVDSNGNALLSAPLSWGAQSPNDSRIVWKPNDAQYACLSELALQYGLIVQNLTVDESGLPTDPTAEEREKNAKQAVKEALWNLQPPSDVLTVKAVDLHLADSQVEAFRVGQSVYVRNLGIWVTITELSIQLNDPTSSTVTINGTLKTITRKGG